MTLRVQFNEETKEFDLFYRENFLTSFKGEKELDNAIEFFKTTVKNAKLISNADDIDFKEKIYLEYLEMDIDAAAYEMDEVTGLEINIYWDGEQEWNKSEVYAITSDENKITVIQGIENNFNPNQVFDGYATNHQIRKCLGEDLQNFIKGNAEFQVFFCGEEIKQSELLNTEKEFRYGFLAPVNKKGDYYDQLGDGYNEVGSISNED